jgi:phosphoglycerol transferase
MVRSDSRSAHATPPRAPKVEVAWYLALVLMTGVAVSCVLQLWRADMSIPFSYNGDAVSTGAAVKGMVEHGWVWVNQSLGAPGEMNTLDYPGADLVHLVVLKVLAVVTGNWAVVVNTYYLLGYIAVALACGWAMRRLGLSRPSALAASVLYSLLPYHFLRGEDHLLLGEYYLVPLLCVLAIELAAAKTPLLRAAGEGEGERRVFGAVREWWPLVVCAFLGQSGIYYAFFGSFFLLVAALWGWWRRRERARLVVGVVLIGTMLAVALAGLIPSLVYRQSGGTNTTAAVRGTAEAEVYSLKIAQVVLPVRHHRLDILARARERYVSGITGVYGQLGDTEADWVPLGLLGTLGWLALLAASVFGLRRSPGRPNRLPAFSAAAGLNLGGVLLATVGGFASVIALVFTQIRAYNRIIVFLAFFAFLVVGMAMDWTRDKMPAWSRAWMTAALVSAVVAFGVADQTTPAMVPAYGSIRASWVSTGAFVQSIQKAIPTGSSVFQLPYVPFPENPPVVGMSDYDHFKPYLQSSTLRWSYGAVKGRETASWQQATASLDTTEMIAALRQAGFAGVWVDRYGYADSGTAELASLQGVLGQPMTSPDGRYAFFALR